MLCKKKQILLGVPNTIFSPPRTQCKLSIKQCTKEEPEKVLGKVMTREGHLNHKEGGGLFNACQGHPPEGRRMQQPGVGNLRYLLSPAQHHPQPPPHLPDTSNCYNHRKKCASEHPTGKMENPSVVLPSDNGTMADFISPLTCLRPFSPSHAVQPQGVAQFHRMSSEKRRAAILCPADSFLKTGNCWNILHIVGT